MLYRRHQAGITLSESEMKLLFPNGEISGDKDILPLKEDFVVDKYCDDDDEDDEDDDVNRDQPASQLNEPHSSTSFVFTSATTTATAMKETSSGSNAWNGGAFLQQFESLKSLAPVKTNTGVLMISKF